jgi:hypothetical protein
VVFGEERGVFDSPSFTGCAFAADAKDPRMREAAPKTVEFFDAPTKRSRQMALGTNPLYRMKVQLGAICHAMQLLVAMVNYQTYIKRGITEPLRVQPPPPHDVPPNNRVTMLPAREYPEDYMTNVWLDNTQQCRDQAKPMRTRDDRGDRGDRDRQKTAFPRSSW